MTSIFNDQKHPREKSDRQVIERLLQEGQTDLNLAELARLCIRYQNFPGARDIQKDLKEILKDWQLTEDELFAKTRKLHAEGKVYKRRSNSEETEDWS